MKADLSAQQRLLALQDVDTAIMQADHRKKSLPEHDQLAQAAARRRALSERLVAEETAVSDAQETLERAEADLEPVRERRERDQRRVDAGQGDAKALQAMLSEIEHLTRRIGELEDAQLEAMEQAELCEAEQARTAGELAGSQEELRALVAQRDEKVAVIDADLATERAKREELLPAIPAELLALYTKIAARGGGVGAARLVGRRCSGCGLEANTADMQRYQAAALDDVLRCEECGRILVRG